jgi:ABC-2 type transport system permease protein
MSWFKALCATEFKKMFSYRVDFWLQFFVSVAVELLVAYSLWKALYTQQGTTLIGGYTFQMMLLYNVFAAFGGRIVRGNERMIIATDIFDGGLTKYLLYPVNYLLVNFAQAIAFNTITIVQMGMGLTLLFLFFGLPTEYHLTFENLLMGTTSCLVASVFYFIMYVMIDYVAFWVDTVWSLSIMFRFAAQFLSGLMIPLEMFPEWAQKAAYHTPFPYIGSEPIKMFLGRSSWEQWAHTNVIIVLWSIPLYFLLQTVWHRGLKNYTGVGI